MPEGRFPWGEEVAGRPAQVAAALGWGWCWINVLLKGFLKLGDDWFICTNKVFLRLGYECSKLMSLSPTDFTFYLPSLSMRSAEGADKRRHAASQGAAPGRRCCRPALPATSTSRSIPS